MCMQTEEEVRPTVELRRHRHFVGCFNEPVQAPTRGQPFYGYDHDQVNVGQSISAVLDFNSKTLARKTYKNLGR